MAPKFRRILLKLSGEILAGEGGHGIDENVIGGVALVAVGAHAEFFEAEGQQ